MNIFSPLFCMALIFISVSTYASTETKAISEAKTKVEIQHLLDYVANTSCQYERNGDFHSGSEAKKHIIKKYNYFKSDIDSTEDFIKFSATQSTITKKKYRMHCANSPIKYSSDWLLEELHRYRNNSSNTKD